MNDFFQLQLTAAYKFDVGLCRSSKTAISDDIKPKIFIQMSGSISLKSDSM
jgi:hypothetical protein